MINVNALTFDTTSKMMSNTRNVAAYINRDLAFEQHQVKIVVTHENQKQELVYKITLENTLPIAKLLDQPMLDTQLREEATKFAQSIIAFHQDKDCYTLSLLEDLI